MPPIPLLYVHSSSACYGSDQALLQMATGLDRAAFRPIVAVPEQGPLVGALRAANVRVIVQPLTVMHRTFDPREWTRLLARLPLSVRSLRCLVEEEGVRLVHTNSSHVLDGALAARAARVPHVWHVREVHTWQGLTGHLLRRFVFSHADVIPCVSMAARVAVRGSKSEDPRLRVIYDGVDTERFHPRNDGSEFRRELGVGKGEKLIGIVGRIAFWKGHQTFLDAAVRVQRELPEVRFAIVGGAATEADRRLEAKLRQQVIEAGLGHAVRFTGVRSDIPRVMAGLDVLVLASRLPEPWGLVTLEAMATARPVIATRQGGPLEMIDDETTGLLVPPDDSEAMAHALETLLRNPAMAQRIGEAARARCEERFTLEAAGEEIDLLYRSVLAGGRSRKAAEPARMEGGR